MLKKMILSTEEKRPSDDGDAASSREGDGYVQELMIIDEEWLALETATAAATSTARRRRRNVEADGNGNCSIKSKVTR